MIPSVRQRHGFPIRTFRQNFYYVDADRIELATTREDNSLWR